MIKRGLKTVLHENASLDLQISHAYKSSQFSYLALAALGLLTAHANTERLIFLKILKARPARNLTASTESHRSKGSQGEWITLAAAAADPVAG